MMQKIILHYSNPTLMLRLQHWEFQWILRSEDTHHKISLQKARKNENKTGYVEKLLTSVRLQPLQHRNKILSSMEM